MKVSDLEGAKLDYWVAKADGGPHFNGPWQPSTDWEEGGPIIERERIRVDPNFSPENAGDWVAMMDGGYAEGRTALIAAMRCYVASRFGEEVPDEV